MPAVSVVIPTFNRRDWISATVRSVLAQTFRDFEVIVVDDGSTDGTAEMLAAEFGDRIRVERLAENVGRSVARNIGTERAKAPLIAFLDSDDLWFPEKLARQIPCFARAEVVMVHSWVGKTDAAGQLLEDETRALEHEFELAAPRGYGYGGITRTWCRMYTSAVIARRDALLHAGGFDPKLSNFEDWDVFWRLARAGEVVTIQDTLVLHRTHAGNTPTIWDQAAIPWLAVNHRHLSELDEGRSGPEDARGRANLLLNIALGEYWRRDLAASRRWMWQALLANPAMLARPAYYVWCAPLLHALLPHRLADRALARIQPDLYEGRAA
jgi:glycosyltransferase involved in cell wall biosynthesis